MIQCDSVYHMYKILTHIQIENNVQLYKTVTSNWSIILGIVVIGVIVIKHNKHILLKYYS